MSGASRTPPTRSVRTTKRIVKDIDYLIKAHTPSAVMKAKTHNMNQRNRMKLDCRRALSAVALYSRAGSRSRPSNHEFCFEIAMK